MFINGFHLLSLVPHRRDRQQPRRLHEDDLAYWQTAAFVGQQFQRLLLVVALDEFLGPPRVVDAGVYCALSVELRTSLESRPSACLGSKDTHGD